MTATLPTDLAWLNGDIVPRERAAPSIASNSFHMATGVFDGMMAYWNGDEHYLHYSRAHFERFKASCAFMDIAFPWTVEELEAGTRALLRGGEGRTYYIRPIGYRGGPSVPAITWHQTTLPVDVCIFAVLAGRDAATPMACQLSPVERVSGRAVPVARKACGVYVNSFMAQRTAERAGFDTGLMLDDAGRIAEASTSNVFFIQRAGGVVTPRLSPEVFPGVTRRLVIHLCGELGIPLVERDVLPSELSSFSAAFLCATLIELRPLSRIDTIALDAASPVFEAILAQFRDVTHGRRRPPVLAD